MFSSVFRRGYMCAATEYSQSAARQAFREKYRKMENNLLKHSGETAEFWKKVFLFVGIPATIAMAVKVYLEPHAMYPDYPAYSYLRIRTKAFPWGDGDTTLIPGPHNK